MFFEVSSCVQFIQSWEQIESVYLVWLGMKEISHWRSFSKNKTPQYALNSHWGKVFRHLSLMSFHEAPQTSTSAVIFFFLTYSTSFKWKHWIDLTMLNWMWTPVNPPVPVQVLLPALYIHLTGKQGCCGNRCGVSPSANTHKMFPVLSGRLLQFKWLTIWTTQLYTLLTKFN